MNINFYIGIFLSIFLVACGGGGGGGGSEPPTPTTPAPTISFSANPTSVLLGANSTLTWSSSNANSCSASGNWSGSRDTSGSETVTINGIGNNSFTLSCSGGGGSRSSTVTIEGFRQTDGVVVDGYISGADVFIDQNDNFIADASEDITTSDNEGKFTIKYNNGNLVSIGGTDLDSQTLLDNLLITHKLSGHSEFKAITPVTSVAAFMNDPSNINTALGIDNSLDIYVTDPVANKGDAGIYDYLYEKGNQLTVLAYAIQNISNDINVSTDTTEDFFRAIAEELDLAFINLASKVDIETNDFITKVFENILIAKSISMDDATKNNTIKALAGVLPIIQVQSTDNLTTAIIRFSLSTLQNDIVSLANATASEEIITSYTTDILNYIAEDQAVDSDEITPDITAIDDTAQVEEDGTVTINVVANDSYITSAPISVTVSNGANGISALAESSPEQVVYSPNADYNGTDTFTYTITQGDKTSSAEVEVTITAVNDAPSIDVASTIQVEENQTAVTTISVSDVDGDDVTLTIEADQDDGASFNLSESNVLTFLEAPDAETKSLYRITLIATEVKDDPNLILTDTKDLAIRILNINDNAPIFESDPTFSIDENTKGIGQVSASDPDNDSFTFTISGSEILMNSNGTMSFFEFTDYETKDVYTETVTVSDGTLSNTQEITININNLNDNPFIVDSQTFYVNENQTSVGTVIATDADGDTPIYSLPENNNNDNNLFEIDSSSGFISFKSPPDYETGTLAYTDGNEILLYGISTKVTGADQLFESYMGHKIYLLNLNDNAPVISSSSSFSIDEGQTEVGCISVTDADDNTSPPSDGISCGNPSGLGYSMVNNPDTNLGIDGYGRLRFTVAPDYETKSLYTGTIEVSDGANSATQDITVNINDIDDTDNNAPVITSSATFTADENQIDIGRIQASDADDDTITFSISGSEITINPASGFLRFASSPDYEVQSTYSATVTASDGTASVTQDISVSVNNLNDNSPAITSSATFTADENQTSIDTVTATDADGDTVTFTISGTEITIDENTGVLTFVSAPDYETKSSYTATVTASDGTNSSTQDITVNVNDVTENSAPVITSSATFTADENQKVIGTVIAEDANDDTIIFSANSDDISINSSTGELAFISAPDYETKSSYTTSISASDGTLSTSQTITINVNNLNDNSPAITSSATFTADENQTVIGTIIAEDADGDSLSYSIDNDVQQNINVTFAANNNGSGNVYVIGGVQKKSLTLEVGKTYKFEHPSGHPLRFSTSSDGIHSGGVEYSSGVDTSQNGITLLTVSANTPTNLYYYCRIHSGMGGAITSSSETFPSINITNQGALSFNSAPDYETKSSYAATVTITDGANSTSQNITVNINDIDETPNEAPTISLTQPDNNEGDTLYPLVLTNDENKLDINLSFSDPETSVSDLTVTATTTAGESISVFHEEGSDISTIDLSNADAGPTDITISVSDGVETVTDTLKIWITRYIAIDNPSDPYSGNRAYTILGNHSNENRKTNYVILSDALPDEDRVDGFRSSVKNWVDLINRTDAAQILANFFSIGIIETPLSSQSALGTATGCDSRDPNIYCYTNQWKTALDSLQGQYFDDVDSRSVITGIDGRGVANPSWAVNIQGIPSTDDPTLRRVVSTLKHEFGHSYSLLADEYLTTEVNCTDFNCGQIEIGPNTTAEDEPEKVRWNHHIEDLTNIPGYHDSTTGEGIGYYTGVYYGADAGFRPSFETIMNGYPSNWVNNGEITREVLWDAIGQEALAIRALIFQGMHSIEAAFDANNDVIVSHNFVDPSGTYEVEWYLNGEKVENNSNTFLLERKSSGYEHVSYRIKEKTQNMIIASDNILNFRDVYSGLFGPAGPYTTDSIDQLTSAGCNAVLTDNPDYANSFCRNTLNIKWTPFSPIYDYFFYDDVDDLINSAETSSWGLQYWYEYSGLGAMFGINWEAN